MCAAKFELQGAGGILNGDHEMKISFKGGLATITSVMGGVEAEIERSDGFEGDTYRHSIACFNGDRFFLLDSDGNIIGQFTATNEK